MSSRSFSDPETERIAAFLREIGLVVTRGPVDDASFLPGIEVVPNGLRVDETRLAHPGDLLHEAGHLAVLSPAERAAAAGDVGDDGGLEMAAIAWSYAAAVHLRLDPAIVFHPDGYRGASRALIENFSAGHTFGVPLLQWLGLAVEPQRASPVQSADSSSRGYPAMVRWLREEAAPGGAHFAVAAGDSAGEPL